MVAEDIGPDGRGTAFGLHSAQVPGLPGAYQDLNAFAKLTEGYSSTTNYFYGWHPKMCLKDSSKVCVCVSP